MYCACILPFLFFILSCTEYLIYDSVNTLSGILDTFSNEKMLFFHLLAIFAYCMGLGTLKSHKQGPSVEATGFTWPALSTNVSYLQKIVYTMD